MLVKTVERVGEGGILKMRFIKAFFLLLINIDASCCMLTYTHSLELDSIISQEGPPNVFNKDHTGLTIV